MVRMKWNIRLQPILKTSLYYYYYQYQLVLFQNEARRREVKPQLASALLTAPFPFGRGSEVRDLKHLRLGLRGKYIIVTSVGF